MPSQLRLQVGERLEREDLEFLAAEPDAQMRLLSQFFLTDPDLVTNPSGVQAWVVHGFNMTNPTGKVLTVTRGAAFLHRKESGQVVLATLAAEGDATKSPDLFSYANGTYGIYIRFEFVDAQLENRIFWDPVGSQEYAQNIPVRRAANWSVAVTLTSPGSEWLKIGQVVVSASPTLAITKQRKFYFDGDEAASYAQSWGTANDRNADRATYGVHSMQRFASAVLQKLKEIQSSSSGWWVTTPVPLDRKITKDGDLLIQGTFHFNDGGTDTILIDPTTTFTDVVHVNAGLVSDTPQDVGSSLLPFKVGYFKESLDVKADGFGTSLLRLRSVASSAQKLDVLHYSGGVGPNFAAFSSDALMYFMPSGVSALASAPIVLDATKMEPGTTNSVDLGSATKYWNDVYTNNLFVTALQPRAGAGTGTLGSVGTPFGPAYLTTLSLDSNVLTDLIPDPTSTLNLGSSTKVWDTIHVEKVHHLVGATPVLEIKAIGSSTNGAINLEAGPAGNINANTLLLANADLLIPGTAELRFNYPSAKVTTPVLFEPTSGFLTGEDGVCINMNLGSSNNPANAAFFKFDGLQQNRPDSGVPYTGGFTAPIVKLTDAGNGKIYVAVHVKLDGSYRTLWIRCLDEEEMT